MDIVDQYKAEVAAWQSEDAALAAREIELNDKAEAVFARVSTEERKDLTAEEDSELAALKAERAANDKERTALAGKIADKTVRLDDIEANRRSAAEAAEVVKRFNLNRPSPAGGDVRGSDHTLDELLWASAESVPGSYGRNVRIDVPRVEVRNGEGRNTLNPLITEFPENRQAAIRAFQKLVPEMQLFGMAISRNTMSGSEGFQIARDHPAYRDKWNRVLRAMDTDTTAEGVEWIPTGVGASLNERVRASGKVAPLFPVVSLPTNPWKWPLEGADATAYRVAEPTGDTATKVTVSTPGTGAATFDAEIFGARVLFSRSLEADSAIAILPYVQRKLVQAFVDAEEKAILDGDTDGTHQDADIGASTTDARTAWDGLRKRGLANSSASAGSALTVALLAARRADMDQYGLNPNEMAFIVPISSYYALVTDAAVVSVDKYGPEATIHNGELGKLYGVPIIVSEHIRSDLNASGVNDGITTTKTVAYTVNTQQWVMGTRTALALETDDSIFRETYQRVVVGWMREDFQNVNARGTSEDDTGLIYNVTP